MERPGIDQDGLAVALETVEKEILKAHSAETFIDYLKELYKDHRLYEDMMVEYARFIEPRDRSVGFDKEAMAARAFFQGELIAFHTAALTGGEEFLEALNDTRLKGTNVLGETDKQHVNHLIAAALIEIGADHVSSDERSSDFLDKYEDTFCPSVSHQFYFRAGFGLIRHMVKQALPAFSLERLERELASIDWDDPFKDF